MRAVIQRVMAAEAEASALVEAARSEGQAHLDGCRRRAQELLDRARREAPAEAAQLLEAAAEAARREREEQLGRASKEVEGAIRLDEAVAREVVEDVLRCVRGGDPP